MAKKIEKYGESQRSAGRPDVAAKNMAHFKEHIQECRGVNVGVHAAPLPGYSDCENIEDKMYWQNAKDYVRAPKNVSRLQLQQDRKWWAKNDKLLLSDLSPEQSSPIDSFKACHISLPKRRELADKVSNIDHFKASTTIRKELPKKTKLRWTEETLKYNLKGKRIMDSLPVIRDAVDDFDPLYSSFSKNY